MKHASPYLSLMAVVVSVFSLLWVNSVRLHSDSELSKLKNHMRSVENTADGAEDLSRAVAESVKSTSDLARLNSERLDGMHGDEADE